MFPRFNKYISIAARATIQALKEEPRVKAERRISEMTLRWQKWEGGKGGEQASCCCSVHHPEV